MAIKNLSFTVYPQQDSIQIAFGLALKLTELQEDSATFMVDPDIQAFMEGSATSTSGNLTVTAGNVTHSAARETMTLRYGEPKEMGNDVSGKVRFQLLKIHKTVTPYVTPICEIQAEEVSPS